MALFSLLRASTIEPLTCGFDFDLTLYSDRYMTPSNVKLFSLVLDDIKL